MKNILTLLGLGFIVFGAEIIIEGEEKQIRLNTTEFWKRICKYFYLYF